MKKLKFLLFVLVAVLLTGCGSSSVDSSLEDVMTKLYSGIKEDDLPMALYNQTIKEGTYVDEDGNEQLHDIASYLGTSDIPYTDGLASESMTGSIAHSVVLIRVPETEDVTAVKTKIKENINPRKWICVGVEEDEVVIESRGNLIMVLLVQDQNNRTVLTRNFKNL